MQNAHHAFEDVDLDIEEIAQARCSDVSGVRDPFNADKMVRTAVVSTESFVAEGPSEHFNAFRASLQPRAHAEHDDSNDKTGTTMAQAVVGTVVAGFSRWHRRILLL